jgi:outer membrane protein assembly factor BamB
VIYDNKVFLTTVEGLQKEKLHVLCYSLNTGEKLWDAVISSTNPEKNSYYISRAAPTPVVDAHGVYAYFESGDVIACDLDGKVLWQQSLAKDYGKPENEFGLSASPVQTDANIVILIDDAGPSYLVALNKQTGAVSWKTDRTSRKSWSSPAIMNIGGAPQIVCSSDGSVDGYDPATGKLLWTYAEISGNTGTTPLPVGDGLFLISAGLGRETTNVENAKKSNGLMKVTKEGDQWKADMVWRTTEATTSWASPIVHQGLAYWINRAGVIFCFDVETGEKVYSQRIKQGGWATPFAVGDHVYVFGKDGVTTVLAAGKEFKVLAENQLWTPENPPKDTILEGLVETDPQKLAGAAIFANPIQYGVAIVNNHIIIRTGTMVFCINK